jgi:hypothetical protein
MNAIKGIYKDESGNYVIKKISPQRNGNPVNVWFKISYGQSRNNETNR